jgi:hypothetical protein
VVRRGGVEVARWTITGDEPCGLALVDELARLELAARRWGCTLWVQHASAELLDLLDLVGLCELASGLEPRREPEGGEEVGVEEVVMPDDPIA